MPQVRATDSALQATMAFWLAWLKSEPKLRLLGAAFAVLLAAYHLLAVQVVILSYWPHLAFHLGMGLFIVFLSTSEKFRKTKSLFYLAALLAIAVSVYIIMESDALVKREGFPNVIDHYAGIVLIILVLAATYMSFGYILPLLAIIGGIYAFIGPYLPPPFFHGGVDFERLVAMLTTELGGIYGTLLYISATYLAVFLTFGAFVEGSGMAKFFIDLPLSLFKGVRAGSGYAAVGASALVGMSSGSPVSNVFTAGTITIPLMKHTGYPPHVAGGIEAAASTGGQLMPPVMGAVAFVMAQFVGVSYFQVITYATVPAILYFLTIGFNVHFQSARLGLAPIDARTLPKLRMVMQRVDYFLPIVVLVGLLSANYSASFAAFWAVMCLVALMLVRNPNKEFIPKVFSCLVAGGRRVADFAVAMACISIFVKIVLATGIAIKLPSLVSYYADGDLLKAYVLTAIASTVLGMGLPTVAAYIVVAVTAVPALTQMGANPIQAHFFALYFSVLSALTPPVALAALASAQVAKADYLKTAWVALKFGLLAFVIPFLVAYQPALLGFGSWYDILETTIVTLLASLMTSSFLAGYAIRKTRIWERGVVGVGAIAGYGFVITQQQWFMGAALGCFVAVIVLQRIRAALAARATAAKQPEEAVAKPVICPSDTRKFLSETSSSRSEREP